MLFSKALLPIIFHINSSTYISKGAIVKKIIILLGPPLSPEELMLTLNDKCPIILNFEWCILLEK